jgi:hypothetical protein
MADKSQSKGRAIELDERVAQFAFALANHHLGDRDELGVAARAVFEALNGVVDLPNDECYEEALTNG